MFCTLYSGGILPEMFSDLWLVAECNNSQYRAVGLSEAFFAIKVVRLGAGTDKLVLTLCRFKLTRWQTKSFSLATWSVVIVVSCKGGASQDKLRFFTHICSTNGLILYQWFRSRLFWWKPNSDVKRRVLTPKSLSSLHILTKCCSAYNFSKLSRLFLCMKR